MSHSKFLNLMLAAALVCGTGLNALAQGNGPRSSLNPPQATKSVTKKPYHPPKKASRRAYDNTKDGGHSAVVHTKEGAQTAAQHTKQGAQKASSNAHRRTTKRHNSESGQRSANNQANPQ